MRLMQLLIARPVPARRGTLASPDVPVPVTVAVYTYSDPHSQAAGDLAD